MRRSLSRTFFRPERPTLTSSSLQSITRPFQKRFREVFGNARILIFYLSIKAWEEKSLPKSHLGWFFLVFGEGKATKENISIFWFIWPLRSLILCAPPQISVEAGRTRSDLAISRTNSRVTTSNIQNKPESNKLACRVFSRTSCITYGYFSHLKLPCVAVAQLANPSI